MTGRDAPNNVPPRRRPAFPGPHQSTTPPDAGTGCTPRPVRLWPSGALHFPMGRPSITPRSGRLSVRLLSEASSPSHEPADERANQCADRHSDHGHHPDRVEMTRWGFATRYGSVHTQSEKHTSTHRPADHGPTSAVLQHTCLQERTITRLTPLPTGGGVVRPTV